MKTEISISPEYCKNWGLWEGVREIVQNWMDSRDLGNEGELRYIANSGTVMARNEGVVIDRGDICLLGKTSKADCNVTRGKFGEGFALGLLALTRAGYKVTVRSGHFAYSAAFEKSRKYGNQYVLVLKDRKIPYLDAVEVKVNYLPENQWDEIRSKFRELRDAPTEEAIEVDHCGTLLMNDADRGNVFAKGIWVCNRDDLAYGYDFSTGIDLDRDRRMVDPWSLSYYASRMTVCALQQKKISGAKFLDLLTSNTRDVEYVSSHINADTFAQVEEAFEERHGKMAVPVKGENEAKPLGHYGLKAVVAPSAMVETFEKHAPREAKLREAKTSVKEEVSYADMTEIEKDNILTVFALLRDAQVVFDKDRVNFVEFLDGDLLGTFERAEDGVTIRIARKVVSERQILLTTLVEEIAHEKGPDGSFAHKNELHHIYSEIINTKLWR